MASYSWLLRNHGKSLKDQKPKQAIAWLYTGNDVDKAWDPCGKNKESWGCERDLFCNKMDFDVIPTGAEETCDLPKITKTDQQELMTNELRGELNARNKEENNERKKKQDVKNKKAKEKDKKGAERQKEHQDKGGKGGKHAGAFEVQIILF